MKFLNLFSVYFFEISDRFWGFIYFSSICRLLCSDGSKRACVLVKSVPEEWIVDKLHKNLEGNSVQLLNLQVETESIIE
jgi:hypothetical protein